MNRVITKTADTLTRFGERIERRLSTGNDDYNYSMHAKRSGSDLSGSVSGRSLNNNYYLSQRRDSSYGSAGNYSLNKLTANPSNYKSYSNYEQNPTANSYRDGIARPPYGPRVDYPANYNHQGGYPSPLPAAMGSVGYAPDYYVAERRQLELIPAPPPRYVPQPVPVTVPVDRPVPQPYPVEVPRPVPVDRPVPVPVDRPVPTPVDRPVPVPVDRPVPVPVDRPVPVPVPVDRPVPVPVDRPVPTPVDRPVPVPVDRLVPVPMPVDRPVPTPVDRPVPVLVDRPVPVPVPSPVPFDRLVPILVPVPVPSPSPPPVVVPVPCYAPVLSTPVSPVMVENSVTYAQRWVNSSPVMMNQQRYMAGSPVMGMNPNIPYGNSFFIR